MATQLSFLGFVRKNLWRRRLRTLLTLCGIGMAIARLWASSAFSNAFEQACCVSIQAANQHCNYSANFSEHFAG